MNASRSTTSCCGRREPLVFWSVTLVLLLLSSALHFWRIGSAPAGFYIDESSFAYNAYCIARTGADEYGISYPVFFRCFGEYKDAAFIYSLVPMVKWFGLQKEVTRLCSALFLLAAAVAFSFLVQEHCGNKWLSVAAGFCFSLLPWVFAVSRTTTQYTAMLLGMTLGWLLLLQALRDRCRGCALGAGVAWAFAMYTYSIARPIAVLLLLCWGMVFWRALRRRRDVALAFLFSCGVALLPLIAGVVHNPEVLTRRLWQILASPAARATAPAMPTNIALRYAEYFSPAFLFFKGDPNSRQHTGFGGELFVFLVPMVLAGIYCLIRFGRRRIDYRFIGAGLLVYPIAAALMPDRMHSGRCIQGAILWMLTAAIGARFLWRHRVVGRKLLIVAVCAGTIEAALYFNDYFGPYQVRSRRAFDAAFTEVLEDSFHALGPNKTLYISESAFAPLNAILSSHFRPFVYIQVLFFGRIDPSLYQQSGFPTNRVVFYDGSAPSPGLLLRCNMKISLPGNMTGNEPTNAVKRVPGFLPGPATYVPNDERVPRRAKLIETKAAEVPSTLPVEYEVYEIQ